MRVLITGATGFVGKALTAKLVADGQEVVVFTRNGDSARTPHASGTDVRQGSLADPNQIAAAATGCQVVYHCAGADFRGIRPAALPWLHVAALENIVAGARAAGAARLVLLSCADVTLDNRDRVNWREAQPIPKPPYNAHCRTKLMGEEVALQASHDDGLQVTAVRPAFLWGAGDRTNLPGLCREALRGGIRLYGAGDNLFSTAHVDNVVHALRLAARAERAPGQAFHVSDGTYQTSREFFSAMATALGMPKPRRGVRAMSYASATVRRALGAGPPWPEDVIRRARACLLDMQRAITDLDYQPITTTEGGMSALAAWAKAQGGIEALARLPPRQPDPDLAGHFEQVTAALEASP